MVFDNPACNAVEMPSATLAVLRAIKTRLGATHFLMKTLPKVATEMALSARLQSHACAEYRRHAAANGSNRGGVSRPHRPPPRVGKTARMRRTLSVASRTT